MAEIRRVQIGQRIETHIRGRVFRYAPKAKKRKPGQIAERRVVCVLTTHDGQLLEHWGVGQRCHGGDCRHIHLTRAVVNSLERDGVLRFVPGSGRNVAAYTFGRTWKAIPSGGPQAENSRRSPREYVTVMQLV